MRDHRWQEAPFIVPARTVTGLATQVTLGLVDTGDGLRRAIRVGTDSSPAILPRQAMTELVGHARAMVVRELPGDRR
jgi:hypothetical protein